MSHGSPRGLGPSAPPLGVPVGYLALAIGCLTLALAVVLASPEVLLGGTLAPRLVAVTHLLTLGFVTGTIYGSLYLVLPFALRVRIREGPADYVALAAFYLGVMGLAWTFDHVALYRVIPFAAPVLGASAWLAVRTLGALRRSRIPGEVKAPFFLAWLGFAAAAAFGLLHAADRSGGLLGGTLADRVAAHAHLGFVGWALSLVLAVGNRLLPMVLPSAMPRGTRAWMPASLVWTGAVIHAGGRIARTTWLAETGVVLVASGLALFGVTLAWMLKHRRRPAPQVPRLDVPRLGALSAFGALGVATIGGVTLSLVPGGPRAVIGYGVLVLLGFFGQLVLAIEPRLVAWLLWMRAYAAVGYQRSPPHPYRLPCRACQVICLATWAVAPWALACGVLLGSTPVVRVAAASLLGGLGLHVLVLAMYGWRVFRRHPASTE